MPHVAVLGSFFLPTTPESTGGLEVWTALLLQELIKKGYTFGLYATEGSINIPGKINLTAITKPLYELGQTDPFFTEYVKKYGMLPPIEYMVDLSGAYSVEIQQELLKKEDTYDFIIDTSWMAVVTPGWKAFQKPVFVICHGGDAASKISLLQFFPAISNIQYVFPAQISVNRATWLSPRQKNVIPHGIPLDTFIFSPTSQDSLTWMGRILPEKGLEDAISVAKTLHKKLTIFGYKQDPEYFDTVIQPLLTPNTNYIANNYDHKHHNACKALLFPTHLEEAFGISIIEAFACGTPVIGYALGAVPEIIEDGVTGFLVNPSDNDIRGEFLTKPTGVAGLIEATQKLYALSQHEYEAMRKKCREVAEKKYSLSQMIENYRTLFEQTKT